MEATLERQAIAASHAAAHRRGRPSNISVPHPAHDTSPVRHRLLRRTGSGRSTGSASGGSTPRGSDAGTGGSGSSTRDAGAGAGAGSGAPAPSGGSRSPAALAVDLAAMELGAEARQFVGSRLSSSSKDEDDEFEQAFRLSVASPPEVVPSPSQRKLDRAHAESRRAREEQQILAEMRLEAAKASPGSASPASSVNTGSPRFDYAAATSRGSTDALKQVQQFVRAQAEADQQAVIAELEQKTRTTLGGPLGMLCEEEEDSDDEDEDVTQEHARLRRMLSEEEEESARKRQADEWDRVGTNWLNSEARRR